jgi:hypothetical protein
MRERLILSRRAFVEIVIWKLPRPLPDSKRAFKYRLAYIANQRCVLRFDNEAGKGDHRHLDGDRGTLCLQQPRGSTSGFLG